MLVSPLVSSQHHDPPSPILNETQLQLKRTAGKLSRDVRGFWLKINKIVTYKQKVDVDAIRRKGMDKQLVFLVQQTEKYSSSLASQMDREEVGARRVIALGFRYYGIRTMTCQHTLCI